MPGDIRVNRKWGRDKGFILKVEWILVGLLDGMGGGRYNETFPGF